MKRDTIYKLTSSSSLTCCHTLQSNKTSEKMGKVVCVTGASGYIASWLVKLLLQRGYTVRATVRSLGDPNKVSHLKALEGAEERLQLFEANLLVEGSFDTVVGGCDGVFHTASPVLFETTDPQKDLIDPAVKGTLNVLNSCKKVQTIKRVVITSSTAAVTFVKNPPRPDFVDETWFSDPTYCEETKQWYALSKTLAQEAAIKFAEENNMDLVMLHPGYVLGPLLQPTLNSTSEAFVDLVKEGKELVPGGVYRCVDVRDVAAVHILAFENPSASGRYCLVGEVVTSYQAAEILKQVFPSLNISSNITKERPPDPTYVVSKEKVEGLGFKYTRLEVSLKDMIESLKEKSFINF